METTQPLSNLLMVAIVTGSLVRLYAQVNLVIAGRTAVQESASANLVAAVPIIVERQIGG